MFFFEDERQAPVEQHVEVADYGRDRDADGAERRIDVFRNEYRQENRQHPDGRGERPGPEAGGGVGQPPGGEDDFFHDLLRVVNIRTEHCAILLKFSLA